MSGRGEGKEPQGCARHGGQALRYRWKLRADKNQD